MQGDAELDDEADRARELLDDRSPLLAGALITTVAGLFMARWRVQTRSPRDVSDSAQWSDAGLEPRMKAHIDAAIERCFDRDFVRAVRAEWL